MNSEEELIMICETLGLIPTCITIDRGANSWGKISFGGCGLKLVWMLTPYIDVILHQN